MQCLRKAFKLTRTYWGPDANMLCTGYPTKSSRQPCKVGFLSILQVQELNLDDQTTSLKPPTWKGWDLDLNLGVSAVKTHGFLLSGGGRIVDQPQCLRSVDDFSQSVALSSRSPILRQACQTSETQVPLNSNTLAQVLHLFLFPPPPWQSVAARTPPSMVAQIMWILAEIIGSKFPESLLVA